MYDEIKLNLNLNLNLEGEFFLHGYDIIFSMILAPFHIQNNF